MKLLPKQSQYELSLQHDFPELFDFVPRQREINLGFRRNLSIESYFLLNATIHILAMNESSHFICSQMRGKKSLFFSHYHKYAYRNNMSDLEGQQISSICLCLYLIPLLLLFLFVNSLSTFLGYLQISFS